ncbi:MAG: hypothetical protein DRQ60_03615 [Gammaproteobacteria bacterium]|nr:MAG: hypothetical protein DRQ60_03615 [Gammaproteobacteria bacterium]
MQLEDVILPTSYKYNKDKNVLYVSVQEEPKLDLFDQVMKDINASNDFPPDVRTIWDFREADFTSIDSKFEWNIISIKKKYPGRSNARLAIIANNDLSFGMSRMYAGLAGDFPQNIRVFRGLSEAEEWMLNGKEFDNEPAASYSGDSGED